MAHITTQFTRDIEIGAARIYQQDGLEIVTTDGGREVRNSRTDEDARRWEISIPTCDIDNDRTAYDSVRQMWTDTERGLHTFDFYDYVDEELIKVRFDSPLQITAPAGHLRHIDTFTLKEALGE